MGASLLTEKLIDWDGTDLLKAVSAIHEFDTEARVQEFVHGDECWPTDSATVAVDLTRLCAGADVLLVCPAVPAGGVLAWHRCADGLSETLTGTSEVRQEA